MTESEDEKNEPSDEQIYSALSFCVILVLVGLPLWWKTTEVYRVSLPYSEIDVLHELPLKIHMNIHVVTIDESKGAAIVSDLRNIFQVSKLYSINFKQHAVDKQLLGSSKSLDEISMKIKHPHYAGSLQLFEVPGLSRFSPSNIVLSENRTIFFASDTDAIKLYNFLRKHILNEDSLLETIVEINLPKLTDLHKKSRQKVPLSSDYDILFTILNPEPDSLGIDLDMSQAIEEYVIPFTNTLQDMYDFHVKSQWLYFVGLQVHPKFINYTDKGPHYGLSADLLPHVITPLEKKLASHVSKYPCLNFILYVPPCSSSPLHLYTTKGFQVDGSNAFISPKWGGIQIYNPDRKDCETDTPTGKKTVKVDRREIMSVFLTQFRLLLGIQDNDEVTGNLDDSNSIRLWEKDALLRTGTVQQLTTAKLTLQSLSKLLGKINNIVINDDVGSSIHLSLQSIYESTTALENGNLAEAYNKSKMAFLASERAFTDPSLLALLYFPDDQKYAVYMPLFLPIMIPVLISFKQIANWAKKKLKEQDKVVK